MNPERHLWISSETGEPFRDCVRCRLPFAELGVPWLMNKDFHRGECILEYAVCQSCRDLVTPLFSEESKASVRSFLEGEIDWESRIQEFMMCKDPADRLRSCVACGAPRESCEGYAVSALFDEGGALVTGPLPLMVCRPCVNKVMSRMSDRSRGVWSDFLKSHFDGPPQDEPSGGLGIF